MTIRSRLVLAMVLLVLATVAAVGLLANYFGVAEPRVMLAGGAVAVLLALIAAHLMARSVSRLLAAETARQEAAHRALAESEQKRPRPSSRHRSMRSSRPTWTASFSNGGRKPKP